MRSANGARVEGEHQRFLAYPPIRKTNFLQKGAGLSKVATSVKRLYALWVAFLTYELVMLAGSDAAIKWDAGSLGLLKWPSGTLGPGSDRALVAAVLTLHVIVGGYYSVLFVAHLATSDIKQAISDAKDNIETALVDLTEKAKNSR